jgi:hypothetical protein
MLAKQLKFGDKFIPTPKGCDGSAVLLLTSKMAGEIIYRVLKNGEEGKMANTEEVVKLEF